jgi:hypothetical protein
MRILSVRLSDTNPPVVPQSSVQADLLSVGHETRASAGSLLLPDSFLGRPTLDGLGIRLS